MRIVCLLTLLSLAACSKSSSVKPEQICQYGTRACAITDAVCKADAELGSKEVCTKRGDVCVPLLLACNSVEVE